MSDKKGQGDFLFFVPVRRIWVPLPTNHLHIRESTVLCRWCVYHLLSRSGGSGPSDDPASVAFPFVCLSQFVWKSRSQKDPTWIHKLGIFGTLSIKMMPTLIPTFLTVLIGSYTIYLAFEFVITLHRTALKKASTSSSTSLCLRSTVRFCHGPKL